MSWIEVKADLPSVPDQSPFVEIFRDYGIENTLEDGSTLTGAIVNVPGSAEVVANLANALSQAGVLDVSTRELPEENWEVAWRQFFKPRRVGKRFVVRPTWEPFEAGPDDLVIVLDPGQAFGTGDHPTTRLCLELLELADLQDATVCDVGCGSGILSVAACKLGASDVVSIDIEPVAVEVAKENATLNDVRFLAMVGEGISPAMDPSLGRTEGGTRGSFDVVISNIISAILIRLARDVFHATHPGSRWIVSGIILQNWQDVLDAAERAGFVLREKREEDGWTAAIFDRP